MPAARTAPASQACACRTQRIAQRAPAAHCRLPRPPPPFARRRRWRAACSPQQPEPPLRPPPPDTPKVWAEVQLLAARAHNMEAEGPEGAERAAAFLLAELARLEAAHGGDYGLVPLRQLLWDLLHGAGRHAEAWEQASRARDAVAAQFGADSGEAQLVAVRLGISTAACGRLDEGLALIYEAAPALQASLALMVERAADLAEARAAAQQEAQQAAQQAAQHGGGGGGGPAVAAGVAEAGEALAALQEGVDSVAAALGEANFYGAVFTLRRAAAAGQQGGVVRGWQELEELVDFGFGSLVASASVVDGGAGLVARAVREHDSLAQELGSDPLLARLVAAQNARLHEVAAAGTDHPMFRS